MPIVQVAEVVSTASAPPTPSLEYGACRWYAAYTFPRHEKRVAEHLAGREVEHFLPLYALERRWKDRRKLVEFPLFPGYVFVRLELRNRLCVLEIPGIVHLVSFNGSPAPLSDCEINGLRSGLGEASRVQPYPYTNTSANMTIGRRVRINDGPFTGLEGKLVRRKGSLHVILSIEMIQRSLLVDVELSSVEVLAPSRR